MMPGIFAGGSMNSGPVITPTNRLSVTNTPVGTASTTHNIAMPAVVSAGDLLLCQFSIPSNAVITTPAGWTLERLLVNSTSVSSAWYSKVAAGTEGGTSVNWATASSVQAIGTVHQIEAGTFGAGLLSVFAASGSSMAPQSPEIPIPWGSTQNTILAGFGSQFNMQGPPTYPTGYSGGDWAASDATTGTSVVASNASAIKTATVASEAPPAFAQLNSRAWAAHTVLIGPHGTPALAGPVVLSTTSGGLLDGTSHLVAMPATVDAGDLMVTLIATHDTSTVTTPSGWTEAASANTGGGSAGAQFGIYYKIAAGTEGGTTVDFVTSGTQTGAATVYRIQAGTFDPAAAPELSTVATGLSVTPLPNMVAPSWGASDTLFIAAVGVNNRRAFTASVLGYSDSIQAGSTTVASTNANVGSAHALYRNATSWPAAFAITNAQNWIAYTLAIKPA